MYQYDDPTAAIALPTPAAAGTAGYFTDGSPTGGVPATILRADFMNMLQAELLSILAAGDVTPSKTTYNQVLSAIQQFVQAKTMTYAADTGAANACVVSYAPAITALTDGMELWFKAKAANTGATTLNVNGLGAEPVVGAARSALQGGEIIANGGCQVIWNATLSSWVLIECTGGALQVAPATQSYHAPQMAQATGVIGGVRNLNASVTTAAASTAFTANEVIVESALGGARYCLANYNETINLATTGAGGMDTGAAPTSGFVAIYAIYNPTTGTQSILATNATSAVATEVYGGANMPSGYTASALLSVWPTNSSSQFVVGYQHDRTFSTTAGTAISSLTAVTSYASVSIATLVPKNAKNISGFMSSAGTNATNTSINVASSSSGIGQQQSVASGPTAGGLIGGSPYSKLQLITPQVFFWQTSVQSGTFNGSVVYLCGYDI